MKTGYTYIMGSDTGVLYIGVTSDIYTRKLFEYRDAGKFQLHAFVVMSNHTHILLTPASEIAIERCVQLIKGGFSFAIRKELTGEIWQHGYHAHRITDDEDLANQLHYIETNPIRRHLEAYPSTSETVMRRPRNSP